MRSQYLQKAMCFTCIWHEDDQCGWKTCCFNKHQNLVMLMLIIIIRCNTSDIIQPHQKCFFYISFIRQNAMGSIFSASSPRPIPVCSLWVHDSLSFTVRSRNTRWSSSPWYGWGYFFDGMFEYLNSYDIKYLWFEYFD